MECNCINEKEFTGKDVKEKIKKNLVQIMFGSNFGEVLYKCKACGQLWEENLSKATYHDWPPILVKISKKDAEEKFKMEID